MSLPFSTSLCARVNRSVFAPVSTNAAINAGSARGLCGSDTKDSRASLFASTKAPELHAASAAIGLSETFNKQKHTCCSHI